MTFPPLPPADDVAQCGRGARLSDSHPRRLLCDRAGSDGCPLCDAPAGLGAVAPRPDMDPRRGVLVAHTSYVRDSRGEICLLPCLISPISSRLVWDTCHILLIGLSPTLSPVEAWRELSPLEDSLEGRRVHIDGARSVTAPLVRERLRGVDLVIGVDASSRAVIRRLPVPEEADVLILAADVPWPQLFACRDFAPLDAWWRDGALGVQSTLRLCALMAHVLDVASPSTGLRPIEHLMSKCSAPGVVRRPHHHEEDRHARA